MKYYLEAYRNYAKFSGRATKEEYYGFNRWNLIVLIISIVGNYVFETQMISLGYIILMITPAIALATRRLHDVGESGWYMLKWNGKKKMRENSMKGTNKYGEEIKNK